MERTRDIGGGRYSSASVANGVLGCLEDGGDLSHLLAEGLDGLLELLALLVVRLA